MKKYCYVNKLKIEFNSTTTFEAQVRSDEKSAYETIAKSVGDPGRVLVKYNRYLLFRGYEKRLLINGLIFNKEKNEHEQVKGKVKRKTNQTV